MDDIKNQHQWYGIKEHIRGYQNGNISQILMFGGHVKMKESLYI